MQINSVYFYLYVKWIIFRYKNIGKHFKLLSKFLYSCTKDYFRNNYFLYSTVSTYVNKELGFLIKQQFEIDFNANVSYLLLLYQTI